MKFVIYARRSEEKDTGESIENQLKICRRYIQLKYGDNASIDEFFDDDYSGKNSNRPAFSKMMKLLKSNIYDYLVFWKLDRISRNALDFLNINNELQKIGVNLISITEGFDPSTATGKLMMTILASVAEMERKNISLRVSVALFENAKKGRWSGGNTPLGYTTEKVSENGVIVPYLKETAEIEIIKYMFDEYKATKSLRAVARMLKEKYNLNKTATDVKRLLINPVYVKSSQSIKKYFEAEGFNVYGEMNGNGMLCFGKEDATNEDGIRKRRENSECIISVSKHAGIVDDNEFIQIYESVKNAKVGKPAISDYTFLNPLVHCSVCGSYMRVKVQKSNEKKYPYFTCDAKDTKGHSCTNRSVRIKEFECDVLDKLEYIYLHQEEFFKDDDISNGTDKELAKLNKRRDKLKKQISNLIRKSAENEDLQDIFLDEIREMKEEIKNIESNINLLEKQLIFSEANRINKDMTVNNLKNIKKAINETENITDKRNIIRNVVKRIEVNGVTKTFDIDLCL